jgi:hypothetical protein
LDYKKVPLDKKVIGEFHSHPYSEKEIKEGSGIVSSYDGLDVPFSAEDLDNYSALLRKGQLDKGDIIIVVAGDAIYGIEIIDVEKAKDFLGSTYIQDRIANAFRHIDLKKITVRKLGPII